MQLVEHHAAQILEEGPCFRMGKQQGELLRRGEQDVRRALDLSGALVRGRIARAGLDADGQPHLGHGNLEIAGDVGRERLQGRDVEGVEPALILGRAPAGSPLRELDEARQEPGERLAGAGRRHEQHGAALARLGEQVELVRPGRPASALEPVAEDLREKGGRRLRHVASR